MYYLTRYSSPLGPLMLASGGVRLAGLWLEGQKYVGDTISGDMEERDGLPVFAAARDWLDRYFAGGKPPIAELPLAPAGGKFRQAVWKILCGIPYGEVATYGEIARKMAACGNKRSMSAQAVGGAVAHNPVSIIIPCHRVVGSGGSLTGYAGGIDAKIRLLELEGAGMSRLFMPRKGTAPLKKCGEGSSVDRLIARRFWS